MSEENNEPKESEIHATKIKLEGSRNCFKAYANYGSVMATPFDIQLIFADIAELGPGEVVATAQARIIMAPEHAALLAAALQKRMEAFVLQHGSLRPVAHAPVQASEPPKG